MAEDVNNKKIQKGIAKHAYNPKNIIIVKKKMVKIEKKINNKKPKTIITEEK